MAAETRGTWAATTRIIGRLRQLLCGIRGHDRVLNYEQDRLSLRCVNCGHRTVGWTLSSQTHRPAAGAARFVVRVNPIDSNRRTEPGRRRGVLFAHPRPGHE